MPDNKLEIQRHSCAHLIAAAVQALYPSAKFGVGPVVEHGFYYDIEFPEKVSDEILEQIEKKAKELAKKKLTFEREEMKLDDAVKLFKKLGQDYKVELLNDLKEKGTTKIDNEELPDLGVSVEKVSVYRTGEFIDLCRGPHVANASELNLGGLKLMRLAGAYWRGSEKNPMMTRIYGVYFEGKKELADYLNLLEEAKKRDHRRLGKELDLFIFSDLVGPGLPIYTFKGALVRKLIIDYSDELQKKIGYQQVHTPNMNRAELFKISGHYDKFKDCMFRVVSNFTNDEYFLKPMNCPQHTQVFASALRSYKDLPLRVADFANLYRDEKPGELNGLSRLRAFAQDDAHCFCREDQIEDEFSAVLGIIKETLDTYGLKYWIRLSLWDPKKKEKYLGDEKIWEKSQAMLENLLRENKIDCRAAIGEAAFYGPKMDIMATDAIGREWQISTIQLDFNMPARFNLKYIDQDGKEKKPVMIHRAIVGSPERFMGILIEHYAGAFPVWLAPVQVVLAPVSAKHVEGAKKLAEELKQAGIRVEVDDADETVGNKVRKAVAQKIPYIVVVGDKEISGEPWMIRVRGSRKISSRDEQEKQVKMGKEEFIQRVRKEIDERN